MSILSSVPDFSSIIAAQRLREEEEVAALRLEVEASAIPLPDELVGRIITRFGETAQSILRHHAGYRLYRLRESYFASVQVFEKFASDMNASRGYLTAAAASSLQDSHPTPATSATSGRSYACRVEWDAARFA